MRWKSYVWFYRAAVKMTSLSTFLLSPLKKLNSILRKVVRIRLTSEFKIYQVIYTNFYN